MGLCILIDYTVHITVLELYSARGSSFCVVVNINSVGQGIMSVLLFDIGFGSVQKCKSHKSPKSIITNIK